MGDQMTQESVKQNVYDSDAQERHTIQLQGGIEQVEHKQERQEKALARQRQEIEEKISKQLILDIIKHRRSVGQVTQEQPTREQIECMLEAATYAPNHHITEPWRFFVVMGSAREELGAIMALSRSMSLPDLTPKKKQAILWSERNKPLRAPVIITVAVPASEPKGLFIENVEAASAAVQNMLLAAEAMGLATLWRTGDASYDPLVKQWFGLAPEDHIVGFVYVGYPKVLRQMRTPTSFSAKTKWLS
jgi:nitroreductase